MYLEIVSGLGETLVGNTPGTVFRCTVQKDAMNPGSESDHESRASTMWLSVEAYPNKAACFHVNKQSQQRPLIFRSDSNAEDLEG